MIRGATRAVPRTRLLTARVVVPVLVLVGALALYLRTGAPSILTGDQAEHQFTAYVVGVPHATGYPLFTMLNALAVWIVSWGDVARRVSIAVAVYSALAIVLVYKAGQRLGHSILAGLLAAVSLALAPEFWSLATIAEVYTLQALFIVALLLALLQWWELEARDDLGLHLRGLRHPLAVGALFAGLGVTHHGSFTPIVVPALVVTVGAPLLLRLRNPEQRWPVIQLLGRCIGWGLLGLTPWLYLAAQYMMFRPFDYYRGQGLPYHPYWGNPQTWGDVINLALGAGFRLKVFTHGWSQLPALVPGYLQELVRQFWWSGFVLGVVGAIHLLRRRLHVAWFLLFVWLSSSLFGLNVAADIPKAHVYFLPAYVIWSLWIGTGAVAVGQWLESIAAGPRRQHRFFLIVAAPLFIPPLAIGTYRFGRMDRSGDWDHRRTAEQILAYVEPNAAILCRWEACMTLRYLQLVEGRSLGVQLDQTEPEAGVRWSERVPLYAPHHPVYAISYNEELAARYIVFPIESVPDLWRVTEEER